MSLSAFEDAEAILPPFTSGKEEFWFHRDPKTKYTLVIVGNKGTFQGEDFYCANPGNLSSYMSNSVFAFSFGAYGDSRLLVWEQRDHIDSALEEAAGWVADFWPGHIMQHDDPQLKELYDEAKEELGPDAEESAIYEQATADLTYTESGYLTSHEWHVDELTHGPLYEAAMYAARALQAAEYNNYDMIPVRPLGKGEGERVELEEADILKMFADADLGLTSTDVQRIIDLKEEQTVDLKGFKLERIS